MTLLKSEKGEKSTVKIEFSVDKATFDAAVEKVYRKQVKKINVPGFRAGKAPRAIIERMYGSGVFYEDAINDLIPENYTAAVKEAGLEPKADNYTNWENTGLDGHVGGHYLSALAYMYASTGNLEIKGRLDYYISELKRCADASGDGYISGVPGGRQTWKEISEGDIRAASFSLNDKWVPLYNIHKIFAGLRDGYLLYGSNDCKEMFIGLADWMYRLTENLSDEQLQGMLASEHGGLNEVFADAAALSGDSRFMDMAKRFSHKRVLEPLLKGEDHLTGMHANTQIPKVIGYKRIADLEGYEDWDKAAAYFWETVVDNRSITIGGNSVREHFHPADDFSSMLESEQGPETCNTYNMLRLTKMLYETSADTHYMDYYERAVYNHILSTINPVQGGFVYFTPMRAGHYRVYSQPQTSFWCCVGSGMENHARYGEMIYSHKDDKELFVNLFIPSILNWGDTKVEQINSFPAEEGTSLVISPEKARKFTVSVRIPEWAGKMEVKVNGKYVDKLMFGYKLDLSNYLVKGNETYSLADEEGSFTLDDIPVKKFADTYYFRLCQTEGSKVLYDYVFSYSVTSYCADKVEDGVTEDIDRLCLAIAEYSACAREYFGYKING